MDDFSEFDVDEEYEKRIDEVFSEFQNFSANTREELEEGAEEYEEALRNAGMPEDEIEDQIESFKEEHLTREDWNKYYGDPDDLDDAFDCDDRD